MPAASAGIRPATTVNPGAVASAARHGLRIDSGKRPRHIDEVHQNRDLVITVCDDAHEQLVRRDDLHWSIPDPASIGTPSAFNTAFDIIGQRVRALSLD